MIEKNDVSAENQVKKEHYIERFFRGGAVNVLFIGNSITRHEPNKEIGWDNDWGMAASAKGKDYVHVAVGLLDERFGKVNYCMANCGGWEVNYFNAEMLSEWSEARDFSADIVVIRLGENMWQAHDKFAEYPVAPFFKKMVEYFTVNPKSQVIITGLFWDNQELENVISGVAGELNATFVPLNDLGSNDENMAIGQFWHNGVAIHPNDLGMSRIAQRIVKAIK
ncbi:MAG: SGNH/GDSL hydrolase family protein [Clostridia bacterium]|nr:SGNH/GDSL hydrolase family protein [Clostridia bacterium]